MFFLGVSPCDMIWEANTFFSTFSVGPGSFMILMLFTEFVREAEVWEELVVWVF